VRLSVLNWLSSLVVVVCTFTSLASPETIVPSGNVSGNWTSSGSPYIVSGGNITVPDGQSLKIGAGVRVEFTGLFKIIVNGHLRAGGMPEDSVVFTYTGADTLHGWRGFRLVGSDSTVFSFCRFEKGTAVLGSGSDSTGGVVYVSGAGSVVKFLNCEFSHNYAGSSGGAVFASPNTSVLFSDCLFKKNTAIGDGGAAFVNNAHGSVFENCAFRSNYSNKGGGAVFNRYANATYLDCEFYENRARSSGGSLVVTGPPSFRRCVFERNETEIAQGGAAYIYDSTTTATFDSCLFRDNKSLLRDGGGAYCWESSPHFTDCQFIGNYSSDDGGAVHAYRLGANPVFMRCLFENNVSSDEGGGLIISRYSRATLTDCIIRNNQAAGRGGGGLYFRLLSEPVITNCVIEGNYSEYGGGGIHINAANPAFVECSIRGNSSDTLGGGLYADGATFSLEGCTIADNHATKHGGGIALLNSSPDISQCRIEGNDADSLGGGIYLLESAAHFTNCLISGNHAEFRGGAICAENSNPTFLHCTVADNAANAGHSIYSAYSSGDILDCVFANQTNSYEDAGPDGSGLEFIATQWEIRNTLFHALGNPEFSGPNTAGFGILSTVSATGDSCDGYGNLFLNPMFDTGFPSQYKLRTTGEPSPAINTAAPTIITTDLVGQSRNVVGTDLPDMGCYEEQEARSPGILWGNLQGTISAGQYRVYGDIIVPSGEKLSLCPGVQLEFMGPFAILVYGVLESNGSVEDSVRIFANPSENILAWRGIRFLENTAEKSKLVHTQIENCVAALGDTSGGGIGIFGGAEPEFKACRILNCQSYGAGGGLRVVSGSATLFSCVLNECSSSTGGGIHVGEAQHATLVSCQIRGCNASSGGAIGVEGGTIDLNQTKCFGNSAQDGGALYIRNSTVELIECELDSNHADGTGGALSTSGSIILVDNLLVRRNTAQYGAGFYGVGLDGEVERAFFIDNDALSEGGALSLDQSALLLSRCLFDLNSADQGGAVQLIHDSSSFERCTVVNNTGGIGAGFYLENSISHINSTQVTDNENGFFFANSPNAQIEFCNLFENRGGNFNSLGGDPSQGPAQIGRNADLNRLDSNCDSYYNIFEDPQYAGSASGNYSLLQGSPSQDAGSESIPCDADLTYAEIGAFYTPHLVNEWVPEQLGSTVLDTGELQLSWHRPDLRRLCNPSLLLYQIEMTDSVGFWQAIGLVPDTSFMVVLPDAPEQTRELRVRSLIIE
jgi:hypothetical protein